MRVHAVEFFKDFFQSLSSLRDLPSHANLRSTTQRRKEHLEALLFVAMPDNLDGPIAVAR